MASNADNGKAADPHNSTSATEYFGDLDDEGPRGPDAPITDDRLAEVMRHVEKAMQYVKAMSLVARAVYCQKAPLVPAYTELQEELGKESSVIAIFMGPWSIELITQMSRIFDHYTEKNADMWSAQINDCACAAKEFYELWGAAKEFYAHLSQDLARMEPLVEAVRKALAPETMKFIRERSVLGVRSLIKEDVFVALLFCPLIETWAEPFVKGGERDAYQKPSVAKDHWEATLAAALTVEETLIPAVNSMGRIATELEAFFGDLLRDMEVLGAVPTALPPLPEGPKKAVKKKWGTRKPKDPFIKDSQLEEESQELAPPPPLPPEKQAEIEAGRHKHYNIVRPKAFWIDKKCKELEGLKSNIVADLEYAPHDDEKEYALDWLENRKNVAGVDLVDIARLATRNPKIVQAMDPD